MNLKEEASDPVYQVKGIYHPHFWSPNICSVFFLNKKYIHPFLKDTILVSHPVGCTFVAGGRPDVAFHGRNLRSSSLWQRQNKYCAEAPCCVEWGLVLDQVPVLLPRRGSPVLFYMKPMIPVSGTFLIFFSLP